MQQGFGAGDIGEEAADGEAVGSDGGVVTADKVGQGDAVDLEEGLAEEMVGDFEADVAGIGGGGKRRLLSWSMSKANSVRTWA